jgi:hypothetical protein
MGPAFPAAPWHTPPVRVPVVLAAHLPFARSLLPVALVALLASVSPTVGACDCSETLSSLVPDIAVSPAELDFGTVAVGVAVREQVQVGNRGTGALTLASVEVEPADAGFVVASAPNRVQPGQADVIEVELAAPFSGTYAAELVIVSDDADTPEVRVPLTAEGGVARLVVEPDPIDLGLVNQGPGGSRAVTLRNEGFDFLTIDSLDFVDDVGFTVEQQGVPASLAPGESLIVDVALQPSAEMLTDPADPNVLDTLRIEASTGPRDVPVRARINLAPVAVAVERDTRQTTVKVGAGTPVFVDSSGTLDPEGDAFTVRWSIAERPEGSSAAIIGATSVEARTTPDLVGRYVVRLRATDEHGAYGEADVVILPRDLAVVLSWTAAGGAACRSLSDEQCAALDADERAQRCCGQSDLDLHLVGPGGALGDYGSCPAGCPDVALCSEETDDNVDTCRSSGLDCAFANRSPEWGAAGRADDPRLDIDDVRGDGPEVVSLNSPGDGTYRVVVHYCLDRISEPTLATVHIFEEGNLLASTSPQALDEGEAWVAAVLVRSNGTWTPVIQPGIFETNVPADLCAR